jgi:hypothetical protein
MHAHLVQNSERRYYMALVQIFLKKVYTDIQVMILIVEEYTRFIKSTDRGGELICTLIGINKNPNSNTK